MQSAQLRIVYALRRGSAIIPAETQSAKEQTLYGSSARRHNHGNIDQERESLDRPASQDYSVPNAQGGSSGRRAMEVDLAKVERHRADGLGSACDHREARNKRGHSAEGAWQDLTPSH